MDENKTIQIDQLLALREITKLNPIAYAKVLKARNDAEQLRNLYIQYEPNDIIGVDYSTANELEYSLRMQALERSVEKDWIKYIEKENDGFGLADYAYDVLQLYIRNKNQKANKQR